MKKIICNRGMGKSTNLLLYASHIARNPDAKIIFVSMNAHNSQQSFKINISEDIPSNIQFVPFGRFLSESLWRGQNPGTVVLIDEIDMFLRDMNVAGYSVSIED